MEWLCTQLLYGERYNSDRDKAKGRVKVTMLNQPNGDYTKTIL